MKRCPNCGANINPSDKRCDKCGKIINNNSSKIILVVIALIIIIAAGAILISFSNNSNNISVVNDTNDQQENTSVETTSNNNADLSSDSESDVEYWASSKTDKFHKPECEWAQKISSSNKIIFHSREEAVNSGRIPCSVCNP